MSERFAFLAAQRLPPSPYYAVGFAYCSNTHPEMIKAIVAISDGGVRITQAETDRLHEMFFGHAGPPPLSLHGIGGDMLRHDHVEPGELNSQGPGLADPGLFLKPVHTETGRPRR